MKVAVINEGSTKHRNKDVVSAAEKQGLEVFNLGMKNIESEPPLSYMETAFISALVINLKLVDFVIGGCGTGQGYMNAVLQYPGMFCGLIMDPVEAFLFSQVNAGNCISLQLNKGYGGIGGDLNVEYILEKLFNDTYGEGYPAERKEIQVAARKKLEALSVRAHKTMDEIIDVTDHTVLKTALTFPGIKEFLMEAPNSNLKNKIMDIFQGL